MTKKSNILVLDAGTTGIKALLFDERLRLITKASERLGKRFPRRGWIEQDPNEILRISIQVLRDAVRRSKVLKSSLAGIAITNQRETIIAWDKRSGAPLYPAIVWEDKRTAAECRALRRHAEEVRRKTGLTLDPYFSATKMKWVLEHVPRAARLAYSGDLLFGTVDTWLMWNLLKGKPHLTDYTNASRTLLFNIHELHWDAWLINLFDVPQGTLPRVLPSATYFGNLRKEILGTSLPTLAVCGDQQASLFAAGHTKGATKTTYGTGAFVGQVIGSRFKIHKPFFTTLATYPRRPYYALEAKVEDCAKEVERALPHPLTLRRTLAKIAKETSVYLKKLPLRPGRIVVDGGAARDGIVSELQAEAIGIPSRNQKIYDGTALGVAMLAKLSLKAKRK